MIEGEPTESEPLVLSTVEELEEHLQAMSTTGNLVIEGHEVSTDKIVTYWNKFVENPNRSVQDHKRPYRTFIPAWLDKQEKIQKGEPGKLIIPIYLRPSLETLLIAELDKPVDERRQLEIEIQQESTADNF